MCSLPQARYLLTSPYCRLSFDDGCAVPSLALLSSGIQCRVPCCAVLWCTCRFDLSIHFGLPDEPCRAAILQQYAHQLTGADRDQLAAVTAGFSGRDLRDVCEQVRRVGSAGDGWDFSLKSLLRRPERFPGIGKNQQATVGLQ